MKLSVQQQNLKDVIAVVSRAIPSKTPIDIMKNFHLNADNGKLAITGTDTNITMVGNVGAVVETPGATTVPADLFTEIVNSLEDNVIDIESREIPLGIHMRCQRAKINIGGADPELYPPTLNVTPKSKMRFTAPRLKKAIESVVFATSTDQSRPAITCGLLHASGDSFAMVGADGFRLSVYRGKISESVEEDIKVLIPAGTLAEMARLLGHKEIGQEVEIGVSEDKRYLILDLDISGGIVFMGQLVDGVYPDYEALLPDNLPTKIVSSSKDLHQALRTTTIMAKRSNNGSVTIGVRPGEEDNLVLTSNADEYGDNEISVPVEVLGEEMDIAFSGQYMLDMMNVVSHDEVEIEFGGSLSPGRFATSDVDEFIHVIMPQAVVGV